MDGKTQICLRILGVLLLVLIFTLQAQASFPVKTKTDVSSALESAKLELRETVKNYETDFQQRLAREDVELDQNMIPNWSLIAANRGK
jgi:hypothetical protein